VNELRNILEESKNIQLSAASQFLRRRVLDVLEVAGRGHLGPALSIIDIIDCLYGLVMKYEYSNPSFEKRDRFILSKGHGCLGLYVVLEKYGILGNLNVESFCAFDSFFGGHPEKGVIPGIEFSTGSLGHGLPFAVGLSMGARIKDQNFRTYVLVGDGELNEGSNWEALAHASKHNLGNLCLIVDFNQMQASGNSETVLNMAPYSQKFESFGFETNVVNGHNLDSLQKTLDFKSNYYGKPRAIIACTLKGKGIKVAEASTIWHHKAKISSKEIAELRESC
jgi:transketolase